jgi:hypothetical protein
MVDYMQGYNNKGTFFCRVVEGVYILYINADYTGTINVRFDAYTQISRP